MSLAQLISSTLCLLALGFLGLDVMTGNILFWMLGMLFFVALWFRLFDLEGRYAAERAQKIGRRGGPSGAATEIPVASR